MDVSTAVCGEAPAPDEPSPPQRLKFWRSPAGQPRWARPALLAVAALAALLYARNITGSGYAPYYSVAARSMSVSWKAFVFTAFDPAATITLDKIGGFLWPQALSARLFGFHPWALTLPQCVEGVVSVLVMYRMVRRWQGAVAGLVAAGLLTMTPVAASMFGHAMLDGSVTMCLVLAADQYQKAVMTGRPGPLTLAGLWIGLGFQAKMMEAWIIVPALAVGYAVAAPHRLRRRLGQLLTAGAVLLAVSLSWVALMTFTPESSRPYADGTTNNSAFAMVFGYNGLDRFHDGLIKGTFHGTFQDGLIKGTSGGSTGGTGRSGSSAQDRSSGPQALPGSEGWGKLFGSRFAAQIGWLYPLALLALVLGLVRHRGAPRTDQRRAGYLMWGVWLITAAGVLSAMNVPHTAYVAVLAPALAALSAAGTVALWRIHRSARGGPRAWVLPATIVAQEVWTVHVARDYTDFTPWLVPAVLVASIVACATLAYATVSAPRGHRLARRIGVLGLVSGCVAVFAAPTAWSLSVLDPTYAGTSFDASAGAFPEPAGAGSTRESRPGASLQSKGTEGGEPSGAQNEDGIPTTLSADQEKLLAYVRRDGRGTEYTFSTDGWEAAAPYIYAKALPVLPLGGFTGGADSVTLAEYRKLVEDGSLRFALLGTGGEAEGPQRDSSVARISTWIKSACTKVDPASYGAAPTNGDGQETLYRCASGTG